MTQNFEFDIQQTIDALQDTKKPLPVRYLYRLSDLNDADFERVTAIWSELPAWRRLGLMEDITELSNNDMLLSYERLCCYATLDEDPKVRMSAVEALHVYEDEEHIPLLLNLLISDSDERVRAAAATALGIFVWLGEIEEISQTTLTRIENLLLKTACSAEPGIVRRSALESLGYSSRDEVPDLITEAYNSEDQEWISSALFAMGRSADEKWHPLVLSNLENEDPCLRIQAVRAAGELDIKEASPILIELLDDPEKEIRSASVWSLSQIGGADLYDLMEGLYDDAEDEDERAMLESAMDNLSFNMEIQSLSLMDYLPADEDSFSENFEIDFDDDEDLEV